MIDLHILQHSLGLDKYGLGETYRNHYVAGPGHDCYEACIAMVASGLMTRCSGNEMTGGNDHFAVTQTGRDYVAVNSPKPPKLSRSQLQYQQFLHYDSDLTFGEWLKRKGAAA